MGNVAPIRILAVDDDEISLTIIASILRPEGCEVHSASSGVECLRAAAAIQPDVILLDVQMPGMSGYDTAWALASEPATSSIPVVLVTALTSLEDRVRGLKAGAVDFLSKPVDPDELRAKVASLARVKGYNDDMKRRRAALDSQLTARGQDGGAVLDVVARFVPQELLSALGKTSIADVRLGDNVKLDMAVLFSDIRSFTALAEKMTPEQSFAFLNSYLRRMNPFVWENGGFIDKYMGDAIMALFPGGAGPALAAAIAMLRHVPVYNSQRAHFGYQPIRIGVGVHRGPVTLGIIGHERFMQGTAISDAVNLASRLQDLTKVYRVSLVVSSSALSDLADPNRFDYRFLDKLRVRGKQDAVSVYEVFDGDPPPQRRLKTDTRAEFEKAVYDFHARRFSQALARFEAMRRDDALDPTVDIYRSRCVRAIRGDAEDLAPG